MRIVCGSCGAKYSIADEKVAGRVFKIRCKKCGEPIVVQGDQVQPAAEEAAAAAPADYGTDAIWHIVLDGDQQGPYTPAQLGAMLTDGSITWDAYVWREGFDDWAPAQDVEELVQAIMGGGDQAAAEAAPTADPMGAPAAGDLGADPFSAPTAAAAPAADFGGGGDDLFGASAAGGGPFGAAAVASRDAGTDLFAQSDAASPFGGAGGDEDEDVVASSGPRVSAEQALTGARNENSVLFSLSNLQALATGGSGGSSGASASSPAPSAGAAPRPGMASGEGSGLIDIRALASATGMSGGGGGGGMPASKEDRVDDLLSIGGGSVGLGSSLAAPVLVPEQKESSSKMPLILGGLAALGIFMFGAVAVAYLVLSKDDGTTTVAAAGSVQPGETTAPAPTGAPETPPTETGASAEGSAAGTPTEPAGEGSEAAATADSEDDEAGEARPSSSDRPRSGRAARRGSGGGGGSSGGGGGGSSASAPSPSPSPSSGGGGGGRRGGSDDIDSLLDNALGGGGGGGRRAAPARGGGGGGGGGGNLPPAPDRNAVASAMNGVQGAVRACGQGASGIATVAVTFTGSTGRVASANASGNFPPPVLQCIGRAVRGASVPRFSQSTFRVNYPFRL